MLLLFLSPSDSTFFFLEIIDLTPGAMVLDLVVELLNKFIPPTQREMVSRSNYFDGTNSKKTYEVQIAHEASEQLSRWGRLVEDMWDARSAAPLRWEYSGRKEESTNDDSE